MENSQNQVKIQTGTSDTFRAGGLRQSDSLSSLIYNLVLENVVKYASIQTRTIFQRSAQRVHEDPGSNPGPGENFCLQLLIYDLPDGYSES